jgi:hypothetical protein
MQHPPTGATSRYRLPVEDMEFPAARRDEAARFALEYAKAELALRDRGIRSTIIVFGGARVPSPERAERAALAATDVTERQAAERLKVQSRYYQVARASRCRRNSSATRQVLAGMTLPVLMSH